MALNLPRCVLFLLCLSCSSSTEAVSLTALNGTWAAQNSEVPGLAYQFEMTLTGSSLSGVGQWTVGQTQNGTVTATGTASGTSVSFDLTLGHSSPGTLPFLIEHFQGTLRTATHIVGTVTFSGGSTQQEYVKTGA